MPNSVKSNQIGCGAKNKNENKTMSKHLQKTSSLNHKNQNLESLEIIEHRILNMF